ncbi:hypothetical protein J3R30DRAFT_2097536 [Lentinula aciculospora]|uniref:BTB domain-containing protein n=1 Tax=Lentinula aciculospora TaxID=153920 RepID=A0A9W9DS93_9AGAR|nr:hypothetical protein J3R30DRAFT_2097536 [Lentinula aciculospora]
MFDISSIFDPIHSKIALLLGLFQSRRTIRNHGEITGRNENLTRNKDKLQTRTVLRRRRASGMTSTSGYDSTRNQSDSVVIRDGDYYYSAPNDDTCCILKAQNTLFKVHKLVICRDGSAFERKLWFRRSGISLGASDLNPLIVRSPSDKFRDLLWVLHAFPPDFYLNPEDDFDESYTDYHVEFRSVPLQRLLNVAEMAHKYSFRSFECWAIHQICRTLRCPTPQGSGKVGTSSAASSTTLIPPMSGNNKPDLDSPSLLEEPLEISDETDELYSRLLLIALTCDHPSLLHYLVQKLVTKILWYNHVPGVSLVRMLEQHRNHPALGTLLGVVYYRILIDMPQTSDTDEDYPAEPQPIFPPTMNVERRMQFLAAHHRLAQTWKYIRSSPPVLQCSGSPRRYNSSSRKALRQHDSCDESWRCLWRTACHQAESRTFILYAGVALKGHQKDPDAHGGSFADVLGLLKITMLQLRKLTTCTSSLCMDCSLEGLEAVDLLRDQLIEGLINMFVYEL